MILGVAYTSTDLEAIRSARLRGVRTVQYVDRTVTYQSDNEMRQVEQDILRELGLGQRPKQYQGVACKGL